MLPRDLDKIVSGGTEQDPLEVLAADLISAVKAGDSRSVAGILRDLPDILEEPPPEPKTEQPQEDEGMARGGAVRVPSPSIHPPRPHVPGRR